jgi:hypothetical protein
LSLLNTTRSSSDALLIFSAARDHEVSYGLSEYRYVPYNSAPAVNSMRQIRLNISDLFEIDPQSGDDAKDLGAITAYVLKHYAFLPKPIAVTLEDDEVVISFPEEPDAKKEEARGLADRAVKRASEGNYEKANWNI